jgi:parallel beta-helix repeat protein
MKLIHTFVFIFILCSVLIFPLDPVRASPEIIINADGTITQPGSSLQVFSNVGNVITYVFAGNISDHITIYRSNIVIDGRGCSLIGTGTNNGFALGDGANNVAIGNMSIVSFDVGVLNRDGSNNKYLSVRNVTIQNCNTGIILGGAQSGCATIVNDTFAADGKAMYIYLGAGNNVISGNSITTSNNCIEINSAPSNTISGNGLISFPNGNGISLTGDVRNTSITWNTFSSAATGIDASYGINDTTISNNLFGYSNCGINVGGNQNSWSSNITVTQNNIYATQNPTVIFTYVKDSIISQNILKTWFSNIISFDHANFNTIVNNNLTSTHSSGYCINLYYSNYTTVLANQMFSSTSDQTNAIGVGMVVTYGYYNFLIGNNISNPNSFGIKLDIADGNTVNGNTVLMKFNGASPTGLWFTEGASYNVVNSNIFDGRNDVNCSTIGMEVSTGANNIISGNTIVNNKYGLDFKDYLFATTNNTIAGNTIQNNGIGVEVYSSTWNYFYNNNFIGNGLQAQTNYYGTPLPNYWNTTFPKGGNYWSDYVGADANGDGIGDTPYVIDASNMDNYPLINQVWNPGTNPPTISVTQTSNGVISPGTTSYSYGSTPSFSITPNTGYFIASITANGVPISVTSPTMQTYQFSPLASNGTLTATYAIKTFGILVTQTSNGVITPGTTSYIYGSTPSFSISANLGYHITSITANNVPVTVTSPSSQIYQFSALANNCTLTAAYAINTYSINVTQTANGLISPGTTVVNYGSDQSFAITPNSGYYIASITMDSNSIAVTSSSGQTVSFTNVTLSHLLMATFGQSPTPTPTTAPTTPPAQTPVPTMRPTTTPTSTPTSTPTPSVAPSSSSNITVNNNSATVDQSSKTGVSVTVTGSSLESGTKLNVTSINYGDSPPSGFSPVSVSGAVFYDVKVTAYSGTLGPDVSVAVTFTSSSFTDASVIEYWNGASWISVDTTFNAPHTVSGNIPSSALTGTPIVVGTQNKTTSSSSTTVFIIIAAVIAVAVVAIMVVFMKKRKSK